MQSKYLTGHVFQGDAKVTVQPLEPGGKWSCPAVALLFIFSTGCVATFSINDLEDTGDAGINEERSEDADTNDITVPNEQDTQAHVDTDSSQKLEDDSEPFVPGDSEMGTDECPDDPDKDAPGLCGCGVLDSDSDDDGTPDCHDNCPIDPDKTEPGECGCGTQEGACVLDCPADIGKLDRAHNLCWQDPRPVEVYSWDDAVQYCDRLILGGHSDWILASRQHYLDLLGDCDAQVLSGNSGYCNPCAASKICLDLFSDDIAWYWTSTEYDFDSRWRANFETGKVGKVQETFTNHIRCVRIL